MVTYGTPFSGFSVADIAAAKAFYADVVGLEVEESEGMRLGHEGFPRAPVCRKFVLSRTGQSPAAA